MFFEMRTRPRGGGVWGGIRAGFGFLFFWQGGQIEKMLIK